MTRGAARRLFCLLWSKASINWESGLETLNSQREATIPMITEIAQIDVRPGSEKDFEAAVAKARPLFLRAKGSKGFELHKSIEKPSRYRLMARWETLENHTVDFRGSEEFPALRARRGPHFGLAPRGEHTVTRIRTSSSFTRICGVLRRRAPPSLA